VQPGGPELLVGTLGPRTIRSAAAWADGLAGMSLDLDLAEVAKVFALARDAWREAGRPEPRLTTSFWFALDDGDGSARTQVHRHLRHYMNWIPAEYVDALAATAGFAGTPAQLADVLERVADLGADEVQLIPTGSGVDQVHRVAELLR
jgi:alkanesulfonate monooxygenase SsuD/methylene tetrahydromethanopterin reductase-like flavin-dependent oxidoreductase (luciferase family)